MSVEYKRRNLSKEKSFNENEWGNMSVYAKMNGEI